MAADAPFNSAEADSVNCKKTLERLSAYLDGELPQAGAAAVREHLQECPRCAARLDELRSLGRALEALEGAAVPPDFAARVRQAAEARREPIVLSGYRRVQALQRTLMRVAAVFMAVAGLWVGMSAGGAVSARGGQIPAGVETAQESEFDLQLASLSAAPPGSVAEAYLAFVGEEEGGLEE